MHLYKYSLVRADKGINLQNAGLRDFYLKSKDSKVEEVFVIRNDQLLDFYFVAPEISDCQPVISLLDKNIPIDQEDFAADHDALRGFFEYVYGIEAAIPADPNRLVAIKEDYSIALDQGAIGPILTYIYHMGENRGHQLQADPVIRKNSILLPEVLVDIALKISGNLQNFQILFIGNQKQKINEVIQVYSKRGKQKIFIYDDNFSAAYQIAMEFGCIPVTQNQFEQYLKQNTLIISFSEVHPDILQRLVDIIRQNRNFLYIFFALSENRTRQKITGPPNLYLQYLDQINSLISQHTNNRRDYLRTIAGQIDRTISDFYNWMYSDERHVFNGIVSADRRMQQVFDLVRRISPSEISVLIAGETGTGKELIARAIHACSQRTNGPFIAVNCSAIPETLLESEMFGYERGAFTGAHTAKKGLIETASGGTLFLDEIGDLPPVIQVKLLRVLQEREIMHLGATKAIKVDIRLVTATNHDLENMVGQGRVQVRSILPREYSADKFTCLATSPPGHSTADKIFYRTIEPKINQTDK